MAEILLQEIGVATDLNLELLIEEIGVATSISEGDSLTQIVGVATSLLEGVADILAEEIGVATSLVETLGTDTRTTWVSVVGDVIGNLHEQPILTRTKSVEQREYGTVTVFGRAFTCARNNFLEAALQTVLAPGAHMNTLWADEWFSLAVDGPKVASVQAQQSSDRGKPQGADDVRVTFAAIRTLEPVTDGAYNVTARDLVSSDAFGNTYIEWGIAHARNATGVPQTGDRLQGYGGNFAPHCVSVQPSDKALPGRWLFQCTYRQKLRNDLKVLVRRYDERVINSGTIIVSQKKLYRTSGGQGLSVEAT